MSGIIIVTLALLLAAVPVLWRQPRPIQAIDFAKPARARAAPRPPFQFLSEDLAGNSPKVMVRDASGSVWQVKGGPEGRAEAFVTRIVSALGYYADSVTFIPRGRVEGVSEPLKRASGFVAPDGSFTYAGFELRDPSVRFLPEEDWTWADNPFVATPEFKGLKILVMLVSDWDNKDKRDRSKGSNTGVLETLSLTPPQRLYYVVDWGQSMGGWGFYFGRTNWNCEDYVRQTPQFITGVRGGRISFGFRGQHTADFSRDITVSDGRWLSNRLNQLTDSQVGVALNASGASVTETECFSRAFRLRIEALRRASDSLPTIPITPR